MRKRFILPTSTKSFHIRNRYSHNTSGFQPTQENFNTDTQGLQSTLSEGIQDNYNDNMDFQYDYDNKEIEELSENKNEELTESENKESSESENEGSSENENEESSENKDEGSSENKNKESSEDEYEELSENEYEESSEDEYEESSEDEYKELSEDEDERLSEEINNNKNNEIEDELSENEEYDNIIDKALDKNKIPSYNSNNEFAPYFENFTTASLFCWIQKHNISTSAYEDLAEIIHSPQFVSTHVIKNIRRFRKLRQHLPLLPILAKSIPISKKKTPSTSKNSKMSYQLSINDIIWHVLNNPSLMKHMYFGPGINSEIKSEFWHGTLWGESPFFGKEKIIISQG
jgi:hypothetical protein